MMCGSDALSAVPAGFLGRLVLLALAPLALHASNPGSSSAGVAVAPQYGSTHVYVAPQDFERFVDSVLATFGGTKSKPGVFQVTPTPSQTKSQIVLTPVGILSVFGFLTPIPYPFGIERTGYLVTDLDRAVKSAREHGADVAVAAFADAIGRDALLVWPGGVHMQLYWHTTAPSYPPLQSLPENRIYVSPAAADRFVRQFNAFSGGQVLADDPRAAGIEIGRPSDTYRRIRTESKFGKVTVLVTDGHLPFPYGREMTGYEVSDLAATLEKARAAGVEVLVQPYTSADRTAALVKFPGGYIAEIHAPVPAKDPVR